MQAEKLSVGPVPGKTRAKVLTHGGELSKKDEGVRNFPVGHTLFLPGLTSPAPSPEPAGWRSSVAGV